MLTTENILFLTNIALILLAYLIGAFPSAVWLAQELATMMDIPSLHWIT